MNSGSTRLLKCLKMDMSENTEVTWHTCKYSVIEHVLIPLSKLYHYSIYVSTDEVLWYIHVYPMCPTY